MEKINKNEIKIAYFSMEIALESAIKSYSGGLGVLAGDTLKSAADMQVPMLGITILNKQGYFKQKINKAGEQTEKPDSYNYRKFKKIKAKTTVKIGHDKVVVQAWEHLIKTSTESLVVNFIELI
jgi:glycogen phosphorylase